MKVLHKSFLLLLGSFLFFAQSTFTQVTIQTDTVIQTSTCGGATVLIPFTVSGGSVPMGTVFSAELSDPFGQFGDPVEIGSFPWIGFGFMIGKIPERQNFGLFYRIRVVSNDLGVTGSPSPNIVLVTSIPQFADVSIAPSDSTCDQPITLSTGFANEYRWNTGETTQSIEVSESGTYQVTLTDLVGCEIKSDPVTVLAGQSPAVPPVELRGMDLHTSGAHAYQWYLEGDSIPGAHGPEYRPIAPGNYQVEVFTPEGCREISAPFFMEDINELSLYPNPVSEILHIQTGLLLDENFSYTLYDMAGNVVRKQKHDLYSGYLNDAINVKDLPEGDYRLLVFWRQKVLKYRIAKISGN